MSGSKINKKTAPQLWIDSHKPQVKVPQKASTTSKVVREFFDSTFDFAEEAFREIEISTRRIPSLWKPKTKPTSSAAHDLEAKSKFNASGNPGKYAAIFDVLEMDRGDLTQTQRMAIKEDLIAAGIDPQIAEDLVNKPAYFSKNRSKVLGELSRDGIGPKAAEALVEPTLEQRWRALFKQTKKRVLSKMAKSIRPGAYSEEFKKYENVKIKDPLPSAEPPPISDMVPEGGDLKSGKKYYSYPTPEGKEFYVMDPDGKVRFVTRMLDKYRHLLDFHPVKPNGPRADAPKAASAYPVNPESAPAKAKAANPEPPALSKMRPAGKGYYIYDAPDGEYFYKVDADGKPKYVTRMLDKYRHLLDTTFANFSSESAHGLMGYPEAAATNPEAALPDIPPVTEMVEMGDGYYAYDTPNGVDYYTKGPDGEMRFVIHSPDNPIPPSRTLAEKSTGLKLNTKTPAERPEAPLAEPKVVSGEIHVPETKLKGSGSVAPKKSTHTTPTGIPTKGLVGEMGFNVLGVLAEIGLVDLYEHITGEQASLGVHFAIGGGVAAPFLAAGYFMSGGGSVGSYFLKTGGGLVKSGGAFMGGMIMVNQSGDILDMLGVPHADNKYVRGGLGALVGTALASTPHGRAAGWAYTAGTVVGHYGVDEFLGHRLLGHPISDTLVEDSIEFGNMWYDDPLGTLNQWSKFNLEVAEEIFWNIPGGVFPLGGNKIGNQMFLSAGTFAGGYDAAVDFTAETIDDTVEGGKWLAGKAWDLGEDVVDAINPFSIDYDLKVAAMDIKYREEESRKVTERKKAKAADESSRLGTHKLVSGNNHGPAVLEKMNAYNLNPEGKDFRAGIEEIVGTGRVLVGPGIDPHQVEDEYQVLIPGKPYQPHKIIHWLPGETPWVEEINWGDSSLALRGFVLPQG